jgi:acetyl coenzyme A synthetase (ADP forming)-like protein
MNTEKSGEIEGSTEPFSPVHCSVARLPAARAATENRGMPTNAPQIVRDVILREGGTLRLRAPGADDVAGLTGLFESLSKQSRYLRFHGAPAPGANLVTPFLDPEWKERGSLVGIMQAEEEQRIVALASWARLRDPTTAEVAFAVADAFQGKGIGTRLLEQLAGLAAEAGIERFVAEVLSENVAMLSVFADAGFDVSRRLGGGTVEVAFPIAPTDRYREAVDRRDHDAVVSSLRPFFEPETVAILGASPRPGSIGETVCRNIVEGGFDGRVYPVNRSGESVSGLTAYQAVEEIPDTIDLALICLPADVVLDGARSVLAHGSRALCVISAGFAEVGPDGQARQEELLELVRGHGARLLGPNCLGLAVTKTRLNATFAPRPFPGGNIGFSSQSGALGLALLERSVSRALGFSSFVSIGNKADVSSNDLLEYWEDDPPTDVVLLYVESFGNPRHFGRIAGRVARRKPILAMKSGSTRSGARAAGSHTAALAGSEEAVNALFRQAGVIRAETAQELIDIATLLSAHPAPRGGRVGIVTNAGGLGILCADACESAGLELSELSAKTRVGLLELLPPEASVANPVDMLGSATAESYRRVLPIVQADPQVDSVIGLFVPAATVSAAEVWEAFRDVEETDKPVLPVVIASETPPGSFPYPESAARALGRAVERGDWLRRPAGSVPRLEGLNRRAAEATVKQALARADDTWLTPAETRSLLSAYGIPLVAEEIAADPQAAGTAATRLGFPVVVKTAEAGAHKTESGGVALDLLTSAEVEDAAARIGGAVLVQPMISDGVELLAGVVQDPVFGPLVAFGPGGVFAELIDDAAFRIAPLTDVDVEELIHSGKTGRLVSGFRGKPPSDDAALADLLHRLSRLADDLHSVAELDLNPVLALPAGCVAVDSRVRVARMPASERAKTW